MAFVDEGTRLVPRQTTVTVDSQSQTSTVIAQVASTSVSASDNGSSLSAGWVAAIISLVILAISITANVVFWWNWRRARRGGERSRRRPDTMYYDISKPARTYSRRERGSYSSRRW